MLITFRTGTHQESDQGTRKIIYLSVQFEASNAKVSFCLTETIQPINYVVITAGNAHHERLAAQDQEIERQNKRLQTAFNGIQRVQTQFQENQDNIGLERTNSITAMERATEQYQRMVEKSRSILGTGSGKVGVLLPESEGSVLNLRRMDSNI